MRREHYILKSCFASFAILIVFFVSILPTFAMSYEELNKQAASLHGVEKNCFEMASTVFGSQDSTVFKEVEHLVNFSPTDDTGGDDTRAGIKAIWNFAMTAYDRLSPIGFSLVFLWFLIDILDKTTKEQLTVEHFIRQFLKLIFAMFLIQNGDIIFPAFLDINKGLTKAIFGGGAAPPNITNPGNISSTSEAPQALVDMLLELRIPAHGTLYALMQMARLLVPWIATLVGKAYLILTCWGRFLELGVRIIFAPIGMSDLISDGFKGNGFRYLKKLFAVIIQGSVILGIMSLVAAINGRYFSTSTSSIHFNYLIVLFTEIGLIKKAQSFANDILGV